IRGGAAGYLLKSEPPARIVEFLRGVAYGEAALSGAVARRLLDQVRAGGGRGSGVPDTIGAALSARELEVLLLLQFAFGSLGMDHPWIGALHGLTALAVVAGLELARLMRAMFRSDAAG
ncbi:MAG: hypothetical protein ABR562_09965, partial [Thermoplasmatota archaeon]